MRISTDVTRDKDLNIDLSGMEARGTYQRNNGTVSLTLREEEVMQLRDRLESYLDARRGEFKQFWNAVRAGRVEPTVLNLYSLINLFKSMEDAQTVFVCTFTKLDGTERTLRGKVLEVSFNYRKRETYARVIDLDIKRVADDLELDVQPERRIVLQRVSKLTIGRSEYRFA